MQGNFNFLKTRCEQFKSFKNKDNVRTVWIKWNRSYKTNLFCKVVLVGDSQLRKSFMLSYLGDVKIPGDGIFCPNSFTIKVILPILQKIWSLMVKK